MKQLVERKASVDSMGIKSGDLNKQKFLPQIYYGSVHCPDVGKGPVDRRLLATMTNVLRRVCC